MRPFLTLMLFLLVALLMAAALAYPVWYVLTLYFDQPIHRVMHRIAMLIAIIGFFYLFRRWKITSKQSLGYALPRQQFLKQLAAAFFLGLAILLPFIWILFELNIRELRTDIDLNFAHVASVVAAALISGLIVSFIEETFFRGALFTVVARESGTAAAIILPSLLYSSVHFLSGRLFLPKEAIDWSSGFAVFMKLTEKYAAPLQLVDSFISLFAVGVLLALVRMRTGAIAGCIGLHAAWVCVISSVRRTSYVNECNADVWLVGTYDGVIGWASLAWMVAIVAVYVFISRSHWQTATAQ